VGGGAGYGVHPVIVGERAAVFGEVGELVEEGVVAILGGRVLAEEALTDYQAVLGEDRLQGCPRAADSSSDRSRVVTRRWWR
jgi:hypothetical protein